MINGAAKPPRFFLRLEVEMKLFGILAAARFSMLPFENFADGFRPGLRHSLNDRPKPSTRKEEPFSGFGRPGTPQDIFSGPSFLW